MNKEIIKKRAKAIRSGLNANKVSCLVVTRPANVTYATGFSGDDSWAVVTKAATYLLTDSRYTEQAQSQCPDCRIIQRTSVLSEAAANLLKKLKSASAIAVENSISLADFRAIKQHIKTTLKPAANIIEPLRSIKDEAEINAIRKAAKIAAKAFHQTMQYVKPSITENELAGILNFQIRTLVAVNSFDTIVAFGSNASRPHHQPGSSKLRKNDTILIDFGVKYKGYCCDITRCFAFGRPNRFYKKVYAVVQQAHTAAIKTIRAGVEIKQVDAAARNVITQSNLPLHGHGTGHGLGLQVHEEPIISAKSKGKLKPGQVITIEPAVYITGKLGIRIEDDILVTSTSHKILTPNP